MNYLSASLRIICGLALIVIAGSMYRSNQARLENNPEVALQVFGFSTSAQMWQLNVGFAVICLIGLTLVILGVRAFVTRPS